ncbi:MAG TPA: acylneuraminate cytidylyltransferase family protein [Kofleriaceae bacterium]|nr:acylneuraminate cytidylyltransferase family protein [Kofleriaceae bacterium]
MRVLGIVPARAGSKRIPGKNLALLGGRTLLERALDAATAARSLAAVALSTDDPRALAIARDRYPAVAAIARPDDLATDESPAIDYVRHALAQLPGPFDAVAIVQPSSPLTAPDDIDATVALCDRTGAGSAVTVMRLDHAVHPLKLKRLDGDRLLPLLEEEAGRMASHELPPVYVRNGAVYVTRTSVIEAGRILDDDCRAVVMPRERSIDINDPLDLAFAEFLLARA